RRRSLKPPPSVNGELAAQAELLDEGAVALEIVLLQVVQKATATADELQQPATRVVVVAVRAQMLGQLVDPPGEHRDLHLRRAGVGLAAAVLRDQFLLGFLREGHEPPRFVVSRASARRARKRSAAGRGWVGR